MEDNPRMERLARRTAQGCTVLAGGAALAVGVGVVSGKGPFHAAGPDYAAMAPVTACIMTLLNAGLFLITRWPDHRAARAAAGLVALLTGVCSAAAGAGLLVELRLPYAAWLTGALSRVADTPLGRMSPVTSVAFVLAAIALGTLAFSSRPGLLVRHGAAALAAAVILIGVVVAYSYLLGSPLLHSSGIVPVAFLTATSFMPLGVGLLVAAEPDTWILRFVSGESEEGQAKFSRKAEWIILAVFASFAAVSAWIGIRHVRLELAEARAKAWDYLTAVTDLKISQIVAWRESRLEDARFLSESPFGPRRVEPFLRDPSFTRARENLTDAMGSMRRARGYFNISLFDTRGQLRLSALLRKRPQDAEVLDLVAAALHDKRITLGQFYPGLMSSTIYLDIAVPLFATQDPQTSHPAPPGPESPLLGAMLLRADLMKFPFPLLHARPTPSPTAETFLVRREANDVLYLSPLRHRADAALSLRVPADSPDLTEARAVRGEFGILEGVDYRDTRVLAAVQPIPQTAWVMVSKVDQEEIYAPILERAWSLSIALATATAIVAWGIGWLWKRRQEEFHRRRRAVESEHAALAERMAHVMKNANDIILLLDENWRIVEANDRAVVSYGHPAAQLREMEAVALCPPEQRAAFAQIQASLKTAGQGVFEMSHQRKDKSSFPVEASIRHIEIAGVSHTLAIIRDVTERKRTEELLRRTEQEHANQLRKLVREAERCLEQERAAVSSHLHDGFGQSLTSLRMRLAWVEKRIRDGHPTLSDELTQAGEQVCGMINEVRAVARQLRPIAIEHDGLVPALQSYIADFQKLFEVRCQFVVPDHELTLEDSTSTAIYRIVQEVMTNVGRHARASQCEITLRMLDGHLELTVLDDGVGASPCDLDGRRSLGILGMKERAAAAGGELWIENGPKKGILVRACFPLRLGHDSTHTSTAGQAVQAHGDPDGDLD